MSASSPKTCLGPMVLRNSPPMLTSLTPLNVHSLTWIILIDLNDDFHPDSVLDRLPHLPPCFQLDRFPKCRLLIKFRGVSVPVCQNRETLNVSKEEATPRYRSQIQYSIWFNVFCMHNQSIFWYLVNWTPISNHWISTDFRIDASRISQPRENPVTRSP